MEKRRRARINNCLNELKTLILDAMKKDVSILEVEKKISLCDFEVIKTYSKKNMLKKWLY